MKSHYFRSILYQLSIIILMCLILGLFIYLNPKYWDPQITLASFLSIPAAVIIIGQLTSTAHISRASYIKDYSVRFRTNKELTESFHYLVYKFGNELYMIYLKDEKSDVENKKLEDAQAGTPNGLCFFNPQDSLGTEQEMRIDNLLGFFDTIGYDLSRGLIQIRDISGVFGYHLDHIAQRKVIQDYLNMIRIKWPEKRSFHEVYNAPTPFRYLRYLLSQYIDYQKKLNKKRV